MRSNVVSTEPRIMGPEHSVYVVSTPRGKKGARVITVDRVEFDELHLGGEHTGSSMTCPIHDGCTRDCSFGKRAPIYLAERRQRLVAWRDDVFGSVGEFIDQP